VTLSESVEGLSVTGTLRGLPPGDHGIHLHMVGKCEPPFTTAGGHWNPSNKKHGHQNPQGPHFGDLGNIKVGPDSGVSFAMRAPGGTLKGEGGLLDTDGASIVIHAAADDEKTDPAGNSGARIACGVVTGG
jgi:superoxide dismutase, Cu-Zn family